MKILFIGNSYTYYNDMPKLFEELANENGKVVTVDAVTKGGGKLYENLSPTNGNYKKICELCEKNNYDVLFLQENSLWPIKDFSAFSQGAAGLKKLVNAKRTILYATWGRKRGSQKLTELSLTSEEMTDLLCEKYTSLANEIDAEISNVGLCFKYITCHNTALELYNPDLSHPSYLGSAVAAICHYHTVFGEELSVCSALALESEALSYIKKAIKSLK